MLLTACLRVVNSYSTHPSAQTSLQRERGLVLNKEGEWFSDKEEEIRRGNDSHKQGKNRGCFYQFHRGEVGPHLLLL